MKLPQKKKPIETVTVSIFVFNISVSMSGVTLICHSVESVMGAICATQTVTIES